MFENCGQLRTDGRLSMGILSMGILGEPSILPIDDNGKFNFHFLVTKILHTKFG